MARAATRPTTEDAVRALARRVRRAESDFLEEWGERAAILEFDAGHPRFRAEAAALDELRVRYEPQRRLV